MSIKLEELNPRELKVLIQQARERSKKLAKRKPLATVRKQIEKVARDGGYDLSEIFSGKIKSSGTRVTTRKSTAGTKVAPKYRNPANKNETWTGRGKPPVWMAGELKKGKKKEDFLIKK